MLKRLTNLILVFALFMAALCPSFSSVSFFVPSNPFARQDDIRIISIKNSGNLHIFQNASMFETKPDDTNRYVVQFKQVASLSAIHNCLKEFDYDLLADSSQKVFSVHIDDLAEFKANNQQIIHSICEDSVLTLSAISNDPLISDQWELERLGFFEAWDITMGHRDVTVAVLDSGIYRQHEDFQGVNIFAGYDAVTDTNGVNSDVNGHGTKVTSIIAAANNNGIGMSGGCGEVSILPIRLCDSTGYVYSSDFIEAIYYAADSGVDIINMSFGGYVYSAAEEAAVEYASGKGCILVSAAGNEATDTRYAGMRSYPASYSNVISVGAIDANGEVCSFSQYNDRVDMVAPGYDITVANAEGGYELERGTSFSTAYVSAALALSISAIDDGVKFTADQFTHLVHTINDIGRDDKRGYGEINIAAVLRDINMPLFAGVENDGVYHSNIAITFNRGLAILDGEPFNSGDSVLVSGNHILEIRDKDNFISIRFITDNIPLKYDYVTEKDKAYIDFSRGTATLDSAPYISGTPITAEGEHCFIITGPYGNRETFEFECNFGIPQVFGVSNGGHYKEPVHIYCPVSGALTLNGTAISSDTVVATNGNYTLFIENNGRREVIYFTVAIPNLKSYESTVAAAEIVVDEEYNTAYLYNATVSGIRVYSTKDFSKTTSFVRTDSAINGYSVFADKLVLLHDNGVTVFSRDEIANGNAIGTVYKYNSRAIDSIGVDGYVYYLTTDTKGTAIRRLNVQNGDDVLLNSINTSVAYITSCADTLVSATEDGVIYGFDLNGKGLFKHATNTTVESLIGNATTVATDKYVFNISNGEKLFSLNKNEKPLVIKDGILITDFSVYDIAKEQEIGRFETQLTSIFLGEDATYKCLSSLRIESINNNGQTLSASSFGELLGAATAKSLETTTPTDISIFETMTKLPASVSISHAVLSPDGKELCAISASQKTIYYFDCRTLALTATKSLRFEPSSVCTNGEYIYISFAGEGYIFKHKGSNDPGAYYNCNKDYKKLLAPDGFLFGLSDNGDLYSLSASNPSATATPVIKSQNLLDFACDSEYIYAYLKPISVSLIYKISVSDFSVLSAITVNSNNEKIFSCGDKVILGTTVFDAESMEVSYSLPVSAIYADAKYILTGDRLLSTANGAVLGYHGHNTTLPIFDSDYNYYSLDGNAIHKIVSQGNSLNVPPVLYGVSNGQIVHGSVTPVFEYGIGYLDGTRIESGDLVESGGTHILTIAFPFGISYNTKFYIEANISSITLSFDRSTISVNEVVKANVSAKPTTYGIVETVYEASNGNAIVYDDGTVIGVAEGECTITATTQDGIHSSSYTLTITKTHIAFDSSYFQPTETAVVSSIPPGTSVETLYNAVSATLGRVYVTTAQGAIVNEGVLHTGMITILEDPNGTVIDERPLSVLGDVDCDGYITANDYYALRACSSQPHSISEAIKYSADLDGNGTVNAFDLLTLKEHLLGENRINDGNAIPDRIARAVPMLLLPERLTAGTTFTASLTLSDSQNVSAISGTLEYNASIFSVVEASVISPDNNGFFASTPSGLYFFTNGDITKSVSAVLMVKFYVSEFATDTDLFDLRCKDIKLFDGSASVCADAEFTPTYSNEPIPDITIHTLPDFVFDNTIGEYTLDFASSSDAIYISAYPEESFAITGSTKFNDGIAEFSAVLTTDEEIRQYSFVCTSDISSNIPDNRPEIYKNTNSALSSVTLSGGSLSPAFHKDITEYYVVFESPEELVISAFPEVSTTTVTVRDYDEASSAIQVICTAESGNVTTYTFNVSVSPLPPHPQRDNASVAIPWIIIGIVVIVVLSVLVYSHIKLLASKRRSVFNNGNIDKKSSFRNNQPF